MLVCTPLCVSLCYVNVYQFLRTVSWLADRKGALIIISPHPDYRGLVDASEAQIRPTRRYQSGTRLSNGKFPTWVQIPGGYRGYSLSKNLSGWVKYCISLPEM